MAVKPYSTFELAKSDQTIGTTGRALGTLYTLDGAIGSILRGTEYSPQTYVSGTSQLKDYTPQPYQMNGSASGLVDVEFLGILMSMVFGLPTTTGTGPYVHTWTSFNDPQPGIFIGNYSDASNSSTQHSLAMLSSISMNGQHGDATHGKMVTNYEYVSGSQTLGSAQPSLSTIDLQDCLSVGGVTSQETLIEFTPSGGSKMEYHDYTNGIDNLRFSRDVQNALPSLAQADPRQMGKAMGGIMLQDEMVDFTYNAMSPAGSGSQGQPDWKGYWYTVGSTDGSEPSSYGECVEGTLLTKIFAQLISGSDYNYLEINGTGLVTSSAPDIQAATASMSMKYTSLTSIVLQNSTASYALPT